MTRRTVLRGARWGFLRRALTLVLWPVGWLSMSVATVLAAVIVIPVAFVANPEAGWFVPTWWSRLLLWFSGAELVLEDGEHLPLDGPAVLVSNHASHLDGPALIVALPRPIFFVAKKELARIPIFGQILVAIGTVIVDRGRSEKARRQMQRALDRVRQGRWVVVFAEGTRSRDGRVAPFKKGGFHLAIDAQVPIVPIAIRGSHTILPKGATHPRRPGTIEIVVGEPIPVEGLDKKALPTLLERTRAAVIGLLEETSPPDPEDASPAHPN